MALIHCDFFSESLGLCTSIYVILPQSTKRQVGFAGNARKGRHPVLYLLHGMSDDHSIWLRRTSIERYVSEMGLAVVMPAVARSFYTDMKFGLKYWTYISEELPAIVQSFFPISDKREDTFAAGLSMGGYGAFKLALAKPERFAAAASLSGAVDVQRFVDDMKERTIEHYSIFGEGKVKGTSNDLFHLADELAKSRKPRPKLHMCCGTDDFLYKDNLKFRDHLKKLKIDLAYDEGPGSHEWGYWDENIRKVLKWLPVNIPSAKARIRS